MEELEVAEKAEDRACEPGQDLIRKKLNLEWIDSEWFNVWLKLARGSQPNQPSEPISNRQNNRQPGD